MADNLMKVSHQQAALVFSDLIDSLIVDIATEAHRAVRLGFDYKLNVEEEEEVRLAAHARAVVGDSGAIGTEIGNKHTVDVFGQTHPTIANEMFECMNCGRPIVAGRFAPHLEKCMGKGRKARIKASRNLSTSQQRRARSSPVSSYGATGSATPTASRTPNRTVNRTIEDIQTEPADANDGESEESHDDEDKDLSYGIPRPGKARSKKCSGGVWRNKVIFTRMSASGLVPVPLHVSPVRASCAASVASLAEAAPAGSVAGMTVEVAVEQFNSFVSGRVPTSRDMVIQKGSKQALAQCHAKSRKMGEKKTLGHALAGSSVMKCGGPGRCDDKDLRKEGYSLTRVCGPEQRPNLQNGSVGRVRSDSSSDLYSICDSFHMKDLSAEPCTNDSVGNVGKKPIMAVAGRFGNSDGQSTGRLDIGVDVAAWICPQMDEDADRIGKEGMVDFGKPKKRPRATFKPKQGQASVIASASGDNNWVTIIEVFDEEDNEEITGRSSHEQAALVSK